MNNLGIVSNFCINIDISKDPVYPVYPEVSKYYFVFIHFYLAYKFLVVQKSAPPQASCLMVLYPEGVQTENFIIRYLYQTSLLDQWQPK